MEHFESSNYNEASEDIERRDLHELEFTEGALEPYYAGLVASDGHIEPDTNRTIVASSNLEFVTSSSQPFVMRYCDGLQPAMQIDFNVQDAFQGVVYDLGPQGARFPMAGGGGLASFKAARPGVQLTVTIQDANFASRAVVNGATFTSDLAPGELAAIFGTGLARSGTATVEVDDQPATVIAATPFQVNIQLPLDLAAGGHTLRITSANGVSEQPIELQQNAPAVFRLDPSLVGANKGATLNQDGKLNLPSNPARRGSVITVFGTGFGTVKATGNLFTVTAPVTVILSGQEVPVAFAGLTPGFVGLYQNSV